MYAANCYNLVFGLIYNSDVILTVYSPDPNSVKFDSLSVNIQCLY